MHGFSKGPFLHMDLKNFSSSFSSGTTNLAQKSNCEGQPILRGHTSSNIGEQETPAISTRNSSRLPSSISCNGVKRGKTPTIAS